jgi:hypothetical protein
MKYRRGLFVSSFLCILLFSCSENKKEETVDLSEITASSNRYKEGEADTVTKKNVILFTDSLDIKYKGILDSLKIDYSKVQKLDTILFPDRFGAKSMVKFYWKEKLDSINFMDWEFKDSLKTQNAFYNWIDCFGKNCKSIKIGDKIKIQKRSMLMLVNENHLIVIDSDLKKDCNSWLSLLKNQQFGEKWKYILYQPKKGKTSWMNFENEELKEINVKI